ncbi:MAG TPA: type II secretion system protein GspG, partial [Thermoanaerobaculia bacterium]|nr:type II secretion system protein GspG [Thermoanaerobaculia bacterium]
TPNHGPLRTRTRGEEETEPRYGRRAMNLNARKMAIGTCVILGVMPLVAGVAEGRHDPDFEKQVLTAGRIRDLAANIEAYKEEKGQFPATLEDAELDNAAAVDQRRVQDGWGRRMLYYHTGASYVLVSFGRDGKPDGESTGSEGWDTDLVYINRGWAKLPAKIDP